MTCFVYIVAHVVEGKLAGPVKVGITANVAARISQIQTGNPRPVTMAFTFACPDRYIAAALETAFHTVFAAQRMTGEWFDLSAAAALRGMCENLTSALEHFLGGDEKLIEQASKYSGLSEALELVAGIDALAEADGGHLH